MIKFFEMTFSTVGVAGFAALWLIKMAVSVFVLKALRDWTAKRKKLG